MSKPMSEEAYRLLSTAPRKDGCPYVQPSPNDPAKALTEGVLWRLEPRSQGCRGYACWHALYPPSLDD